MDLNHTARCRNFIAKRGLYALLIASCVGWSQNSSNGAEMLKDLVFAQAGGRDLKLDLVYEKERKMQPLVICIHGGGWAGGARQIHHKTMWTLSGQGYAVATVEYRLTDVAAWPAQIDDVRAAHNFLRKNAAKYNIDSHRIGLLGDSAGGHLSLMLGLAPKESSDADRVRAIVNLYGPTDLRDIKRMQHVRNLLEPLINGKLEDRAETLRDISPVVHVTRTDPTVLTLHGTEDPLVRFRQAEILHKALKEAKIPNQLFPMQGAKHGLGGDVAGGLGAIASFLRAYLKAADQELPLLAFEDFGAGATRWETTDKTAWKLKQQDGRSFFSLQKRKSDYQPPVRSPHNIALLKDVSVGDMVLDVDMKSTNDPYGHQDLCLFFGRQDASHFYYVHFGRNADPHANSIFLVNGKPRVSIASKRTEGTDWSRGWHRARIVRDVASGSIRVYFDDMQKPIMEATDKTFGAGQIGIGSFDDTGDFDTIRVWGNAPTSETSETNGSKNDAQTKTP